MKKIIVVLLALLPTGTGYALENNRAKTLLALSGSVLVAAGVTQNHNGLVARRHARQFTAWAVDAERKAAVSTGNEAEAWAAYGRGLRARAKSERQASKRFRTRALPFFIVAAATFGGLTVEIRREDSSMSVRKEWRF
jgi:hypothetical protein